MAGAFQTSRDIFSSPIWKNIVDFRMFFLIYGNAVFAEEGFRLSEDLTLQRGQWCRSTRKLQEDLVYIENRQIKKYSTSVINRCIKRLVDMQMICTKTHELGTVFTVVNYAKYQGFESYRTANLEHNLEHSGNSGGTLGEQSGNNNKNVNKAKKVNKVEELKEFDDMPHVRITKTEFEKLIALIGSEDKVMTKLYSFAEWILKQPKKKQETASAYLSITKWHRLDKEKEKPQAGGEQVEWTGAGDGGNVVPIAQGKPKSLTEQFARRAQP